MALATSFRDIKSEINLTGRGRIPFVIDRLRVIWSGHKLFKCPLEVDIHTWQGRYLCQFTDYFMWGNASRTIRGKLISSSLNGSCLG